MDICNRSIQKCCNDETATALGKSKTLSGRNLVTGIGGLFGYVVGLFLRSETSLDETTANAVLTHETLHGWYDSLTLTVPHGEWCAGVKGRALFNYLAHSGIFQGVDDAAWGSAADFMKCVDISSSTTAVALDQGLLIPFAPFFYANSNFAEEDCLIGAIPIELAKERLSLTATLISALTNNWRLNAGTASVTMSLHADVVWLDKPIAYVPSYFRTADNAQESQALDIGEKPAAIDYAAAFDDDFSSFTGPTEARLIVDGAVMQQLTDYDLLGKARGLRRVTAESALADPATQLVSPVDAWSPASFVRGSSIEVLKHGAQHSGDHHTVWHGFGTTSAELLEAQLKAQAVKHQVVKEALADFRTQAVREGDRLSRLRLKGLPFFAGRDVRGPGLAGRVFSIEIA